MPSIKFRVLVDTEKSEDIFRDIVISSSANFEVLYRTILESYEFAGDQLASFYMSNESWDKGHEIILVDMGLDSEIDAPSLMAETPIKEFINQKGQKIILVYDFIRMWCFLIEVVDLLDSATAAPFVELSVGDSPDETSRVIDGENGIIFQGGMELGEDIDDIFGEYDDEDDEDYSEFDNIDDFDF